MERDGVSSELSLERAHELPHGVDGLVLLLELRSRLEEALEINDGFLETLQAHGKLLDGRRRALWEAEACFAIADLHFDVNPDQDRIRQAEEACDRALSAFRGYGALTDAERYRLYAQYYALLSRIQKRKRDSAKAGEYAEKALEWQESLVADKPSPENRETLATIQGMLGLQQRDRALMEAQAL